MNLLVQTVAVDAVVILAAAWLVWSFGPESLRRLITRKRQAKPAYDVALHADGLDGRPETAKAKDCGPDCGCG